MPYRYLLAHSAAGLSVHLAEARADRALCGNQVTHSGLHTPFALTGCKRCARAALKSGTDYVVDLDGERVPLRGFRPVGN